MKILIIGNGGREHALAWKLSQSDRVSEIITAPGNGGTAELGRNVDIAVDDVNGLLKLALGEQVDWTVVGPEVALAAGVVDRFQAAGLNIFGPTQAAAQLESSKDFAKAFMAKYEIPTATYASFDDAERALAYIGSVDHEVVVKADGLAAGKGVIVPENKEQAMSAVQEMLDGQFGEAGQKVVIEQKLSGEEATLLCFCDGKTLLPMLPAQDHKRVYDKDRGPNTGGMGVYAPTPRVDAKMLEHIQRTILAPTLAGLQAEGIDYRGVLYVGLMLDGDKAHVIEYNARFGDPETQVILPMMKTDLIDVFEAIAVQQLENIALTWETGAACCVVMASRGYPGRYVSDIPIHGLDIASNALTFQAGTRHTGDGVVTAGGRVLGVTGMGPDLKTAITHAYNGVERITFDGAHYRTDIGQKGLSK